MRERNQQQLPLLAEIAAVIVARHAFETGMDKEKLWRAVHQEIGDYTREAFDRHWNQGIEASKRARQNLAIDDNAS